MRTLILLPLLAVLSLVPAKARAACTGPGEVPEWVKRFEHGATSCDKLSQRLSTVRVPRADNAVAVDWEEWRQAPLVVVSHGTISFNGEVVVDIGPDHRVPESAFNGQTIKKLRAAANVYREAHLRDGSVTGAIVVAKADTPHPTFRERLHRAVVVVDAETPYQTVGQVLYTLALARYGTFGFAVGDQNPGRKGELKAGSASGSTPMSAQRPYQLSVAVTAQGFTILGADDVLFPGGKPAAVFDEPTHPCAGGSCEGVDSYDWDGLKATLVRVKKVRPRTMSMIVVSSEGVSQAVLVRLQDVARLYDDAGAERALFPWTVLAGGAFGGSRSASRITPMSGAPGKTGWVELGKLNELAVLSSCSSGGPPAIDDPLSPPPTVYGPS